MRDYLMLCEWQLPQHPDEYTIHINETEYKLRIQNQKIKVIHTDDMANIYKTSEGYSISRLVDKTRENYRTYRTIEEAKSMRKFLREHDWNQELFQEEYDKRYPQLPEYIYTRKGMYQVCRKWKGMTKSYGIYKTIEEAQRRVEYLKKHNWQTTKGLNLVNYEGTFHVYKNIPLGFCTPFRNYYYSTEKKEEAEKKLEQYKTEGFPKPYCITNKYRYIIRNRQLFYIFYHGKKRCYSHTLKDALIVRDILELTGWKELLEGGYVVDDVRYVVEYNPFGTPVFIRK